MAEGNKAQNLETPQEKKQRRSPNICIVAIKE
jgi:hypothetical protein